MYKINDIPLRNYGLIHGRADNSNIALSGFLDMPERLGKTHHDWSDELGTQPYVLASEIQHGGRDLTYHGYMKGADRADAIARVNELYTDINQFTALFTLNSDWGSFQVYVKEAIRMEYLGQGWVSVEIPFREPVVSKPVTIPSGSSVALYNIDNVPYEGLGIHVTNIKDNFNRPATKEPNFKIYGQEGYQVTRMAPMELTQELYFIAPDFTTLKSKVDQLHALLASPGTRIMNVDNMERECFNIKGFAVSGIRITPDKCGCAVRLPLTMVGAGVPVTPEYLLDTEGIPVLDIIDPIRTPSNDTFLLDNDGNNVLTTQLEKTVV